MICTTKLKFIIDTFMIDLRSNLEFEDEEFFDIDGLKKALSAIFTTSHKFLKNRETSVIDNSVV